MATSRLERIGTIYSRATGLLQSGAVAWNDRPLWYDIYKAFPPKEEPRFDRPIPNMKMKQIFYKEDKIRATFHRNNKHVGVVNLLNTKQKSLTQRFIETYQKLEAQYDGKTSEEQLYKEAVDMLRRDKEIVNASTSAEEEAISLSTAFKEAEKSLKEQNEQNLNIKISDIFK